MVGPRLNAGARKLFDRIGIRPMAPGESSAERFTGQKYSQGLYGYSNSDPVPPMAASSPLSGYGMGMPGVFRGAAPMQSQVPFLRPNEGQVGSPLMGGRLAGGAPGVNTYPASSFAPPRDGRSPLTLGQNMNPSFNFDVMTPEYDVSTGPVRFGGPMGMARGGMAPNNTASSYFAGQMSGSPDPREAMLQSSIDQIGGIRAQAQGYLGQIAQSQMGRQQAFDTRWNQYPQQAAEMNQYGANPSISPGSQYANQVASQVGYGANGVDVGLAAQNNANRQFALTNSNMAQRFGPNSPLTAQGNANVEMMQRERNGEGVMMQIGGYGSPLTFVPRNQNADPNAVLRSREQAARLAGNTVEADTIRDANRAKGDAMRARQAERRAARGGLTERQGRELERDQRRQSQELFQRGISPNSPLGQAMAPDLQGRQQGVSNYTSPLTREDGSVVTPVAQGAPKTAQSVQEAATAAQTIAQQAPIFTAMGFDAGASPDEMPGYEAVVDSLSRYMDAGRPVGDVDLDAIHQYAIQLQQADRLTEESPGLLGSMFDMTDSQTRTRRDMFRELGAIPAGNRDQLKQWWSRYSAVPRYQSGPVPFRPPGAF